jgi:hypothetical protein
VALSSTRTIADLKKDTGEDPLANWRGVEVFVQGWGGVFKKLYKDSFHTNTAYNGGRLGHEECFSGKYDMKGTAESSRVCLACTIDLPLVGERIMQAA